MLRLHTEANLQGELYHQCRLIGVPIVLELCLGVGRLDCAILNESKDALVAVVECKSHESRFGDGNTPQICRYKLIGVPVYGLAKIHRAPGLAKVLLGLVKANEGVPIAQAAVIGKGVRRRRIRESREHRWSENLSIRSSV